MNASGIPEMSVGIYDVEICSCVGLMPLEKRVTQTYLVNVELCFPYPPNSDAKEDIRKTVNYADLYSLVKSEFANPPSLLETLAERISQKIKDHWEMVVRGYVSIKKLNPPIEGMIGMAGIKLEF